MRLVKEGFVEDKGMLWLVGVARGKGKVWLLKRKPLFSIEKLHPVKEYFAQGKGMA